MSEKTAPQGYRMLDHPYAVESLHLPDSRRVAKWADGSSVAVSFVIWLDYFDTEPSDVEATSRWAGGGQGSRPYPDFPRFAHREYGHRVGVFRLLRLLKEYGFPLVLAVDGLSARGYPALMESLRRHTIEYIAHGKAATRIMTSQMSAAEELEYVTGVVEDLASCGIRSNGWLSSEYCQTPRTPEILLGSGFEFHCDWANDEIPYRMMIGDAHWLWAVPSSAPLDDSFVLEHRGANPVDYYASIVRTVKGLLGETDLLGRRSLVINLRPYLTGQPFRASYFEDALRELSLLAGVGKYTPSQLVSESELAVHVAS